MVKSRLTDLNLHLFEQLERLNDEELKGEKLEQEINRSKVITDVAQTIINNGSLALKAAELANEYGITSREFPKMLIGDGKSENEK